MLRKVEWVLPTSLLVPKSMLKYKFDNLEAAKGLVQGHQTLLPITVIHTSDDPVVPPECVERLLGVFYGGEASPQGSTRGLRVYRADFGGHNCRRNRGWFEGIMDEVLGGRGGEMRCPGEARGAKGGRGEASGSIRTRALP